MIRNVINRTTIFVRRYHDRVIELYERPKNVGSFDKKDPQVGTGLVGAPACFHGNTLIATEDGNIALKDIKDDIPVWSYNIEKKNFEVKLARVVCTGKKPMWRVKFSNRTSVVCTNDHKFLIRKFTETGIASFEYKKNKKINPDECIAPFKGLINTQGLYTIQNIGDCVSIVINYNYKIIWREYMGDYDAYTLQVEENNNYAVLTNKKSDIFKNIQSGIIVKNCGDVLKLQIKVGDDGIIEDTCFKTYGCGSAIASSSLATEWIKGESIKSASNITNTEIAKYLNLPPVKIHCSILAEDAIKAAITDYQKKKERSQILHS